MAGSSGVDFSFARISAADLKGQGYSFVCRYLASSTGKRVTVAEIADFQREDLGIVLVWEDEANAALGGFNQGQHDAQEALNQAGSVGWPSNLPIYFAVDFDAAESAQPAIDAYLKGAASVLGHHRVGIYGGYYVVKRCLDNGTAAFAWQTVAWSGGQVDPRANIYQNGQSAFGGNADIDEAKTSNFGQWSKEAGNNMYPNTGDLTNFYNATGWNGHPPNENDVAYWTTGTGNPEWANGADAVWKALVYDVTNYVLKNPVVKTVTVQAAAPIADVTPSKPLPQLDNNVPSPQPQPKISQPNVFQRLWKVLWG